MEPRIDRTEFGSVTIDGKVFDHDVIIRLGGQVKKRKKKLSKAVYGISHTMSGVPLLVEKRTGAGSHRRILRGGGDSLIHHLLLES